MRKQLIKERNKLKKEQIKEAKQIKSLMVIDKYGKWNS